jgi:hypothetical protein
MRIHRNQGGKTMKLQPKIALAVAVLALSVAPAMALGDAPSTVPPVNQGTTHAHGGNGPTYTPAPPSHAKAYGRYCSEQGASKKHVAGQKGTPFSQCVTALAHAAHNPSLTPREACQNQNLSKKHVKGQKGTPFSQCVVAAAHLRHDEQQS